MELVISDVDGTLLRHNEKTPSKAVSDMINKVTNGGRLFAIATGRSYVEIKKLFSDSDKCLNICCDGAVCVYKEKTVFEKSFTEPELKFFDEYEKVVLYGKYMMYIKGTDAFVRDGKKQFFSHAVRFENTSEITEPIYKAVIHKQGGKIELSGLNKIYESYHMTEFVSGGVDKLAAVSKLLEKSGIDADDCIVFGDGENDKSMLSAFKKSYAMAWSKPSVKACAKNVTDSVVNTWNMIERNE